jgi:hypothetical protein
VNYEISTLLEAALSTRGTRTFSRLPFTAFIGKVPVSDIDESLSTFPTV